MRALVSLPEHLQDAVICGISVWDLLARTCREAGLEPQFGDLAKESTGHNAEHLDLGREDMTLHLPMPSLFE